MVPKLQIAVLWRYFTTEYGVQCVTIIGTSVTLKLCAECWDIVKPFDPAAAADTVVGQGGYGLMTCVVLEERTVCLTVRTGDGVKKTVTILKMRVLLVPIPQVTFE